MLMSLSPVNYLSCFSTLDDCADVARPSLDVQGRLAILKLYAEGIVSAPGLDLETIARGTPGLAGADLENLINQAAVKASKEGDSAVRLHHLEWARDRYGAMVALRMQTWTLADQLIASTQGTDGLGAKVALHPTQDLKDFGLR
jgi:ATP-dependent metalloprotease